MINIVFQNIIRFIVIAIFQILVFNNIRIGGVVNPYFYVIFILLLPFETSQWVTLLSAFFLGLTIDLFGHTPGIHASASVFAAFVRPLALRLLSPRDNYEIGTAPRISYYGLIWFGKYAFFVILLHHIVLYFVDIYTFNFFVNTLLKAVMGTIFSLTIIVISQYLVYRE